jgi:hypothetical protein
MPALILAWLVTQERDGYVALTLLREEPIAQK